MLRSIARQWRLSARAVSPRDRALAFLLGIHGGLGEQRRLARKAFRWAIARFGNGQSVMLAIRINKRPLRFAMRRGDHADYLVVGESIQGGYEPPPIAPVRVIDAGGDIGTFSLAAAALFPGVPITIYEPDQANFALLTENLRMNGIEASVIKKAVWSGEATLYFQSRDSNSGFVSEDPSAIEVKCELPEVGRDDWLKLDVEGAEYQVLPALFSRGTFPYFISMELHHRKAKGDSLIALARANGYFVKGPLNADADCINISLSRVAR